MMKVPTGSGLDENQSEKGGEKWWENKKKEDEEEDTCDDIVAQLKWATILSLNQKDKYAWGPFWCTIHLKWFFQWLPLETFKQE